MNEILDSDFKSKNKSLIFSKIGTACAIIAFLLFAIIGSYVPDESIQHIEIEPTPSWLIYLTFLILTLGVMNTIFSFVKKEKSSFFKWCAAILNFSIVAMLLAAAILSRI